MGWREGANTVFIFDEAQLSYWDMELWNDFFKDIKRTTPDRWTIVFASYGSPNSCFKIKGTPIRLSDMQRVTLRAIDHRDGHPAVGLLFSQEEMDDLVSVLYPHSDLYFDPSFFVSVFHITGGHVRPICDFLEIVAAQDSYRALKNASGKLYTWDRFLSLVGSRDLLKRFTISSRIFARGIPEPKDLQDPVVTQIFSSVLCYNYVTNYNDDDNSSDDDSSNPGNDFPFKRIKHCFRRGWLHSDKLSVIGQEDRVGLFYHYSTAGMWNGTYETPKSSFRNERSSGLRD